MFLDDQIVYAVSSGYFPKGLLNVLAGGFFDQQVFKTMALSENITREAALKIYERSASLDPDRYYLHGYLASNDSVPEDVLVAISTDENMHVNTRVRLAMNVSFPAERLESLLKGFTVEDVGMLVGDIRRTFDQHASERDGSWARSGRVMAILYLNSVREDARFAFGRIYTYIAAGFIDDSKWEFLLSTYKDDEGFKRSVAGNDKVPSWVLDRVSKRSSDETRKIVARNKNAGSETLYRLSDSDDHEVRLAVAMNVKTPLSTLKVLSRDWNEEVSYAAMITAKKVRSGCT